MRGTRPRTKTIITITTIIINVVLILLGEVSPCAAISLIAPNDPHGAISEIRRYPLCGDTPQRPTASLVLDNDSEGGADRIRYHTAMRRALIASRGERVVCGKSGGLRPRGACQERLVLTSVSCGIGGADG